LDSIPVIGIARDGFLDCLEGRRHVRMEVWDGEY
jgi:hypothetical protein